MEINQTKREKFMEFAGKRVNNVLHDMQILEPMARSASYDFTRQDVDEMFAAMQETLNNVKAEFEKKFEEKARSEKKVFTFGQSIAPITPVVEQVASTATYATEPVTAEVTTVTATAEPEIAYATVSTSATEDVATVADDTVTTTEDTF